MPLWQSMQVNPASSPGIITFCAASDILWMSIASSVWQLRHSRELLAFMLAQTSSANTSRCCSNFAGVSMVPRNLCQSSLLAWIFR